MAKGIDGLLSAVARARYNGFTATSRSLRGFTFLFLVLAALWCVTMTKTSIPARYFPHPDDYNYNYNDNYNDNGNATTGVDGRAKAEPVDVPLLDGASISSHISTSSILPTASTANTNSVGELPRDTATFVISCGTQVTDAVGEMRPLLASMLAFSSGSMRLVFLTDEGGASRVDAMFSGELVHYKRRLTVEIIEVADKLIEDFAYRIKLDPYGDRTGRWAIAKLMVPWLLPQYDRVVVVDTDMIFMDDPLELWKEHSHDDGRWVYRMPLNARHSNNDICSCIVLFNLKRARKLRVYPTLFRAALSNTYTYRDKSGKKKPEASWYSRRTRLWRPSHGDQGMYWILMAVYPNLFSALPQKWNREKCHNYSWIFNRDSKVDVGIFHRNCGGVDSRKFNDDANHQFDFFLHYKWHWLKAKPDQGFKILVFHSHPPEMPTT